MSEEECPHGLDRRWCSVCLHGATPRAQGPSAVGRWFRAVYDGECRACGLPIYIGQQIVRMTDDTYQHAVCAK
jgi:hypothetical protein